MKRNKKALVTVGIPTYSRLNYLKEAVASAVAQSYPQLEVLISQNPHSISSVRDEIAAYCRHMSRLDSRIRHRLLSRDIGPPGNFNAIADAARGDYIMMIGDDDRLLPHAIERLMGAVDEHTSLAFCNRYIIDAAGRRSAERTRIHAAELGRDKIAAGPVGDAEICAWQQATQTENSLIRRRDFVELRFREDIDAPDIEFYIFLARRGGTFKFVPECLAEYRYHDDSTTGRGFRSFGEVSLRLAALSVRREVEPYKRKLLERLTVAGISQCLLYGEVAQARALLASSYCPGGVRSGAKGAVMRLCGAMPASIASGVYRLLYAVKNRRAFEVATS